MIKNDSVKKRGNKIKNIKYDNISKNELYRLAIYNNDYSVLNIYLKDNKVNRRNVMFLLYAKYKMRLNHEIIILRKKDVLFLSPSFFKMKDDDMIIKIIRKNN